MKKRHSPSAFAFLLVSLMLISSLAILSPNAGYAQPDDNMTFTSGEKIDFTSNTDMTFKSNTSMQFWSGVKMKFGTNITMQFIETEPDGLLLECDVLQIIWIWPPEYMPEPCSWWEVIDPITGKLLGEFHIDWFDPPFLFHIDIVYPGPIPVPVGGVITAREKIDIVEPCEIYVVHWPEHWWPEPCTWWEIMDPETGELTGYEFHVDWTNESCEFHIDEIIPGPYILPFPWYEIWARRKIPGIKTCYYFVVEEPPHWWPEPCTWWEIIDFYTGKPTGYNFHVDWTNESCEFHIDEMDPGPYVFDFPVPYVIVEQKITEIKPCDWFIIVDPPGWVPEPCSWWEVLDDTGAPTGLEFHVDVTDGITIFHVDETKPDIIITIPPSYTVTVRKKIDIIQPCDWFRVDDPSLTPEPCSWWEILDPATGGPTGFEFHVDQTIPADGLFHVDEVLPGSFIPRPIYKLTAEKKIDDISPCDWFRVIDPPGFVPEPCSWWEVIWPTEWARVIFHVDLNNGIDMFHVDFRDPPVILPPPTPLPWNVTARPYKCPWYLKPPYPDYAPSGMPDFDEHQAQWFCYCGPVAVANSLWWLDSKYESIYNPAPVPPPTISDSFDLVTAYGAWDDHDVKNVGPLVTDLAWWMDTNGQRTGDPHTGTFWSDMEWGINQYLQQQGVNDTFEVHSMEFPEFEWIEYEIERCQDVVLLLEFWNDTGTGEWERWPYEPGGDGGHYVTCAGVNSTTYEILVSDPSIDAYELGHRPGFSPVPHPPHGDPTVHNDTQYVSYDGFPASRWTSPPFPYPSPYGVPVWELVAFEYSYGFGPTWHAFIRAAVVTSPLEPSEVPDIAVIDVVTSKSGCPGVGDGVPYPVLCQGRTAKVYVTVENQGNSTESFDVTVYANDSVIKTYTVTNLAPGNQETRTVIWNATGWAKGNYTIKAIGAQVAGEIDTADNTFIDKWIMVVHPGDLDNSGEVDITDVIMVTGIYRAKIGDPEYNACRDVVENGEIDISDVVAVTGHYREKDC